MVITEKLPRGFFEKGHLLPRRARACLHRGAQAPHDAPLLLPRCAELKRRPPHVALSPRLVAALSLSLPCDLQTLTLDRPEPCSLLRRNTGDRSPPGKRGRHS